MSALFCENFFMALTKENNETLTPLFYNFLKTFYSCEFKNAVKLRIFQLSSLFYLKV